MPCLASVFVVMVSQRMQEDVGYLVAIYRELDCANNAETLKARDRVQGAFPEYVSAQGRYA